MILPNKLHKGNYVESSKARVPLFCFGQDDLTLTTFLSRRNKDRDFSMGGRAIFSPASKKLSPRRDISMKELKDAEVRGMTNEMFDEIEANKQDSDVEDGAFMVQIPKSISRSNLAEPDYMSEVRVHDNQALSS